MCQGPASAIEAAPSGPSSSAERAAAARPSSRRSSQKDPTLIAGKEVVGRQVAVWSDKTMEWAKAAIAQFNIDKGQHLIRFAEREPGSVKHEEIWVNLAKTRFQWLGNAPNNSAPNPTYSGAPRGEDAVGYRVRVFWPGMARWYQGTVQSYEASSQTHTVKYRDGDIQRLKLRFEAVLYLDKLKTPPRERAPRKDDRKSSKRSRNAGALEGGAGGSSRSRLGSKDDGPPGPPTATPPKKRKINSLHGAVSTSTSGAEDGDEDDDDEMMSGTSDQDNSSGSEDDSEMSSDDDGEAARPLDANGRRAARRSGGSGSGNSARRRSSGSKRRHSSGEPGARRRGRPPGSGTGGNSRRSLGRPQARTANVNDELIRAAGAAVVGARVAVFWNEDLAYYKGKLIQFDSYHKRHKVVYDDGEEEWVALPREAFRYLSPRARSAGCSDSFRHAMAQLGADQEAGRNGRNSAVLGSLAGSTAPIAEASAQPPAPADAAGWTVSLCSASDGRWHGGEVLCHDSVKGKHLVLYDDGEDEWVNFAEEQVAWHAPPASPAGGEPSSSSRQGVFPGKHADLPAPAGRDAVGWRVAVFWPGDVAFYSGEIVAFDDSAGRHEVAYDDGEESTISLAEDKVKWILPPGAAVDPEALERIELGGGRPRRRVTATGGDSDPDYEFEQQQAAAAAAAYGSGGGRGGHGGRRGMGSRGGGRAARGAHFQATVGVGGNGGGGWDDSIHDIGVPAALRMQSGGLGGGSEYQFGVSANPVMEFAGEPAVVRRITRVPAFALSNGGNAAGGDSRLPSSVAVRIYLSSSVTTPASIAAATAQPTATTTTPAAAAETPASQAPAVAQTDASASAAPADEDKTPATTPATAVATPAAPPSTTPTPAPPTAATPAAPTTTTATTTATASPAAPQLSLLQRRTLSPAGRLQSRLHALDLMARRIGRAQQAIVKGVPTDLPTHVVRPLRMGPPPGIRALAAARKNSSAAPGTHRLARHPGVSHSPFHRRRNLHEEEEEDNDDDDDAVNGGGDGEDRSSDGDDANANGTHDQRDGSAAMDGVSGADQSSSGSSDVENDDDDDDDGVVDDVDNRSGIVGGDDDDARLDDDDDDEMVLSPRSAAAAAFPRGGKIKPNSATTPLVVNPPLLAPSPFFKETTLGNTTTAAAVIADATFGSGGGGGGETRSDDANNAAHPAGSTSPDMSMQDFHSAGRAAAGGLRGGAGGLGGSDSVANLLALPRNASVNGLLPLGGPDVHVVAGSFVDDVGLGP